MAAPPKPTNDRIVELLTQILRELGDMRDRQSQMSAVLSKVIDQR